MIRIGQGFDVHAFEEGDHVIIGGVRIPHEHGLRAHSDGDVLLHTVAAHFCARCTGRCRCAGIAWSTLMRP